MSRMADNRRILNIYKQGQGAWARFTLAAVVLAMVLWMLASIDASFETETPSLHKEHTVLKVKLDDEGKLSRELTVDDLEKLPENVQTIMVAVGSEESAPKSVADVETEIRTGSTVMLGSNVTVPQVLNEKTIGELRNNPPADKIAVKIRREWGDKAEEEWLSVDEIEKRFEDGFKLELNDDVIVNTWWNSPVVTVPGIDVPLRWRALIMAAAFALCGFGTYKLLNKPRLADFLIESESELRRVDWPSKPEVVASTKVVVVVVVLMMILLFFLDLINATLIKDGLFRIFLPKLTQN